MEQASIALSATRLIRCQMPDNIEDLRKKFAEATELLKIRDFTKGELDKIKFAGTRLAIVEIPTVMGIKDSWTAIDQLILRGYTIKGVVEREKVYTSWVFLEKMVSPDS